MKHAERLSEYASSLFLSLNSYSSDAPVNFCPSPDYLQSANMQKLNFFLIDLFHRNFSPHKIINFLYWLVITLDVLPKTNNVNVIDFSDATYPGKFQKKKNPKYHVSFFYSCDSYYAWVTNFIYEKVADNFWWL